MTASDTAAVTSIQSTRPYMTDRATTSRAGTHSSPENRTLGGARRVGPGQWPVTIERPRQQFVHPRPHRSARRRRRDQPHRTPLRPIQAGELLADHLDDLRCGSPQGERDDELLVEGTDTQVAVRVHPPHEPAAAKVEL